MLQGVLHKNCTEDIPALHNRMVVFVDDQLNRLKINHVSESEHVFILGPVSMVANYSNFRRYK
jgi:aryl-phospho-beta-D-glucosidase BglC (GH1 family)